MTTYHLCFEFRRAKQRVECARCDLKLDQLFNYLYELYNCFARKKTSCNEPLIATQI